MTFLTRLFGKFTTMRPSLRALVFLYWIYAFTGGMIGVFTQIFLYQKFTNLSLNIVAAICLYTGIMLGFCVPGVIAAFKRLNIKQGFLWSFLLMGVAILCLLHITTVPQACLAMLLWGVGQGIFWLTVNTFELSETKDHERDFYSSVLNAGNQVLSLAGPAFATLLIWLSGSLLHLGSYTLLFTIAPCIFLLGFFCFASIRDYRPSPIQWADISYFFLDRKNQVAQCYTAGTGLQQILGTTVPPLVILLILGSALRVGVYDTVFSVFSALCIVAIAQYRTPSNRLAIYGLTTLGIVMATVWFGFAFSFLALLTYTFVEGILSPLMNVSSHAIDLGSMEIGRAESDFYATMILRVFFLWVWRCVGGILFLVVAHILGAEKVALSAGLYLLAAGLAVTYLSAFFLNSMRK